MLPLNLEKLWFAVMIEDFSSTVAEIYIDLVLFAKICRILLKS